jgi:hypothetical protein
MHEAGDQQQTMMFAWLHGNRSALAQRSVSPQRRYVSSDSDVAYNSSLTVGMMGLAAASSVQHALHSLTGSVQPQGLVAPGVSGRRADDTLQHSPIGAAA